MGACMGVSILETSVVGPFFYEIACFSILASASGGPHLWSLAIMYFR